ncbi:hypothetical protein BJ912DRAFT_513188 [Pholiota molesta]|nr:hypothetical protein BJ912DRAFT_513188 [Pholiota molesta]
MKSVRYFADNNLYNNYYLTLQQVEDNSKAIMVDNPRIWEVLMIAFVIFGTIAAITVLVVVYTATCKRHPAKSFRPRQHVLGVQNQNEPLTQDSNVNASVSNPHKPQHQHHHNHHRRHFVYYLDGDGSNPFIGLKNIFGRHPGSASFSSDSSSGSLAISPSHPAIFGAGRT